MAYGCNSSEIVEVSTVRIEDGELRFDFTCPRCGHKQCGALKGNELVNGKMFDCANVAVCGVGHMHFYVAGISWEGCHYEGQTDVRLTVPSS